MKRRSSMRAAMSALRARLGPGVEVTSGKTDIFVYVTTGDAAIWAAHAAREVLAQHGVSAGFRLERWDPAGEAWQDATAEPRDEAAAALRDAREYLMEQERQRSAATGRAAWQVRVELPLSDDVRALARRLVAEGWPIVRRRKYLIAGADCEDDASDLARAIRGYTAIDAVILVQRGVYGLPWWAQPGGPVGPPMLSPRHPGRRTSHVTRLGRSRQRRRSLVTAGKRRPRLRRLDLDDVPAHRQEQLDQFVLLWLSDTELVERRPQMFHDDLELTRRGLHPSVRLAHAPAGVGARTAGDLTQLVGDLLLEPRDVGPRELPIGSVIAPNTGDP